MQILLPAHPNVPLAIGSGWTNSSQVICYGSIMMVLSIIASVVAGYPISSALMEGKGIFFQSWYFQP